MGQCARDGDTAPNKTEKYPPGEIASVHVKEKTIKKANEDRGAFQDKRTRATAKYAGGRGSRVSGVWL